MKSSIDDDIEFSYLKWILNNVNYVKKLKLQLYIINGLETNQSICKSPIDANFIRQYCLPNEIVNVEDFYFYIYTKCKLLLLNDINKIINSFKINTFFTDHQWSNVQCFYDKSRSYQHIYSSNMNKIPKSIILL